MKSIAITELETNCFNTLMYYFYIAIFYVNLRANGSGENMKSIATTVLETKCFTLNASLNVFFSLETTRFNIEKCCCEKC